MLVKYTMKFHSSEVGIDGGVVEISSFLWVLLLVHFCYSKLWQCERFSFSYFDGVTGFITQLRIIINNPSTNILLGHIMLHYSYNLGFIYGLN